MSIKGNVFPVRESQVSALDAVESTLNVDSDGAVSFKSNLGRGSGKPVEIPGEQFDQFVDLMRDIAQRRETLASANVSADNDQADTVSEDNSTSE